MQQFDDDIRYSLPPYLYSQRSAELRSCSPISLAQLLLGYFPGPVGGWSRIDYIAQLRQTKFELGLSLAMIL